MKRLFITLVILLAVISCGGPGDYNDPDDISCSNVPNITDVVFYTPTGDDFNPPHESVFNIGDEFKVIVYATDCNLDTAILYSNIEDPDGEYGLPDQVGVERGYTFVNYFTIADVPTGVYIVEFQIEDQEGHLSNIYEVLITVK